MSDSYQRAARVDRGADRHYDLVTMTSKRVWIFAALTVSAVAGARGAELPTRNAPSTPPPAKTCTVNGKPGVMAGASGVCLKLGGYVSGQVEGGNVKNSETLVYH